MNRDRVREKIEQILIGSCEGCVKARFGDARDASEFVAEERDQILSIPELAELLKLLEQAGGDISRLAVLTRDQSLPNPEEMKVSNPFLPFLGRELRVIELTQQDMWDKGWRRTKVKGRIYRLEEVKRDEQNTKIG